MVTDGPEGINYWKVTHGIRLTYMPGFGRSLSETERWQASPSVRRSRPATTLRAARRRCAESGPSWTQRPGHGSACDELNAFVARFPAQTWAKPARSDRRKQR
jgi:hypothetical protein